MANQTTAIISIGASTTQLERDIQKALSNVERNIKFSPTLNTRGFALGRITGDVDDFSKSLDAANKRVLAFGANAAVIGGTIKLFRELASSTVQVDKALIKINSIFNLSSKELKSLSTSLFNVARQTSQSFDTVSKAAEEFARQGLSVEETLKRVQGAMTLTRQSGLEITKSVDSITAALNGFAKENLNVSQVVNKLIAVDTRFAVSSADLAEALSRVGNTASDAGVSFDELIGLVTSAQQITARGGAVIGNALKTIFTRVQRSDTLNQLEDLGIKVRDMQNNVLPAGQVLKNLAGNFDNLTQAQKQAVVQLTAGTFQVNQLRAILSDLGKTYSFVTQAQNASSTATNEATKRNEILNQSLDALLQNTKTTFTEIGSIIGKNTFANPLKEALNLINDNFIVNALKNSTSDEAGRDLGGKIAAGLLSGIENVIGGPGLVYLGGLISKVGVKLAKDTVQSFANVALGREKELKVIQGIQATLSQAAEVDQIRFKMAASIEEKERIILNILQQQNSIKAAQSAQLSAVASNLSRANQKTFVKAGGFAGGYLPIHEESMAISAGVGGAPKGARPVVLNNFAFSGGKRGTIVANSSEYLVPNFANGGSAIFNQNMIKKYGLPSGAKKIAAGGYIPNAAEGGMFSGADKLRQITGSFASTQQLSQVNAYFELYKASVAAGAKNEQEYAKKRIRNIGLNEQAQAKILDAFDKQAKAILIAQKAAQKQALEQEKLAKETAKRANIENQVNRAISELNVNSRRITPEQFAASQKSSSERSQLALNSGFILNNKNFAARDDFLSKRIELGRNQAFKNISERKLSGQNITKAQEDFLKERFAEEGRLLSSQILAPGSARSTIKTFVNQYVDKQISQLNNAFNEVVAAKNQGSVFAQLEQKTSGLRGFFRNINKQVEEIIVAQKLSPQAADALRSQAGEIRNRRANRIQNAAIIGSFALPIASGFINEGEGGTTRGQTRGAIKGALETGGLGLSFGSFFGPMGAAIGGLVGATGGGIAGAIAKATKSFEEISKTINDLNAKNQEQINNVSTYIQLQQQLNNAIEGGAPKNQIDTILGGQRLALSRINNFEDRQNILSAGGDINKLAQILNDINLRSAKQSASNDVISSLFSVKKDKSFFSSGLKGKDIEDAANALSVAINISDEKVKKSFEQLKLTFENDPLNSFKNLAESLNINQSAIEDTLKLFKKKPEELRLILSRLIQVQSANIKDLEKIEVANKRAQTSINFGKSLRRLGEENILSAEIGQQNAISANKIFNARSLAQNELFNGNELTKLSQQNQINIQNAIREANIQNEAAIRRAVGKIQERASDEKIRDTLPDNLLQKLQNLSSIDDFKSLSKELGSSNEEIVKILNDSYIELSSLRNNSSNSINELKQISRLTEIQARFEQRNRILAGSQFNAENINNFAANRIAGGTLQFARGGRANQFNALSSQIEFADQLGLGQTSETARLRDLVRSSSARVNFSEILSSISGKQVGNTENELRNSINEIIKKEVITINDAIDKDIALRIQNGIDIAGFDSRQAISEINKGGLDKFVSAGKISLGEGGVISGLTNLSVPLTGIESKLDSSGPIATILKEIAQNRTIANENKRVDAEQLKRADLEKRLTEAENNLKRGRNSALSFEDVFSGISSNQKFTEVSSLGISPLKTKTLSGEESRRLEKIKKFLEQQQKSGIEIVTAIENLLQNQNLLNETGFSKEQIEKIIDLSRNRSYKEADWSGIENLIRERDLLIDQLNELNNNSLNISNYSFGQRGRTKIQEDNFSISNIDSNTGKFIPNSFFNPITTQNTTNQEGQLNLIKEQIRTNEQIRKRAAEVNATYQDRVDLLIQLNELELKQAQISNDSFKSFSSGFKSRILEMKKSMYDLSDVGRTFASSLESNLGNSWGDFITGAQKGKDAFRQFIIAVMNDTARAFGQKAISGIIGSIGSSFMAKKEGGPISSFAGGGQVPAMVMGGEYYFTPQQVNNIESRYGKGYVDKINKGQAPMYAGGGPIKGGSGFKDDIFAMLDDGGYVITKPAVQKYGNKNLDIIANGRAPQKKFWGGFLIGALIGGATSYASSDKKNRNRNAVIGGIVGGIAGGLSQNYSQTGSAFKSDPNASTFQFSPSSKMPQGYYDQEGTFIGNNGTKTTTPSNFSRFAQTDLGKALIQGGLSAGIGIGTSLAQKKKVAEETLGRQLSREEIEYLQDQEIKTRRSQGQFAYLGANNSGGYDIRGYTNEYATRRLAKGGPVKGGSGMVDDLFANLSNGGAIISKSASQKYGASRLKNFANGGGVTDTAPVSAMPTENRMKSLEPSVYIKIDINNNGETNASTTTSGGKDDKFGQDFAQKLSQTIRNVVRDEMIQQDRAGGLNYMTKRQS